MTASIIIDWHLDMCCYYSLSSLLCVKLSVFLSSTGISQTVSRVLVPIVQFYNSNHKKNYAYNTGGFFSSSENNLYFFQHPSSA